MNPFGFGQVARRIEDGRPLTGRAWLAVSVAALVALAMSAAYAAPMYQWTDERGNRHFTDNPYSVPGYQPPAVKPPQRRPARVSRPPRIPPSTSEAVEEGAGMSSYEALVVEERLKTKPDDLTDRARILGYLFSQSLTAVGPAGTIEARRRHILWLIENHPEAELAGLSEATIDPAGQSLADRPGYEQARRLWLEQVQRRPADAEVLRHAAKFFTLPDKETAERLLKQGQKAEPQNAAWGEELAFLYALGVMAIDGLTKNGLPTSVDVAQESGPFARKSRQALQSSTRASEVFIAGRILSMYGPTIRGMRLTTQDHSIFAEQLLKKSETLGAPQQQVADELSHLYELRGQLNAAGK